eukprot:353109-Chlamydomonas_euryale.AAC.1
MAAVSHGAAWPLYRMAPHEATAAAWVSASLPPAIRAEQCAGALSLLHVRHAILSQVVLPSPTPSLPFAKSVCTKARHSGCQRQYSQPTASHRRLEYSSRGRHHCSRAAVALLP